MNIALTNDDGIRAPGIHALAKAARKLGKVTVIAPDRNWSVCGHSKALRKPLHLDPFDFPEADAGWVCDGSPSDCAAFAGLGFRDDPFDLLLSGINPTPNLGQDLTYSGTVMAAVESTTWGLPAIAFSIDCAASDPSNIDFSAVNEILPRIVRWLETNPLPKLTCLNVNVPALPFEKIRGFQLTRSGSRIYRDILIQKADPFGRPVYWFGGEHPESCMEEGTDGKALADGYVSITPIGQDLTNFTWLDQFGGREPEI